MLDFSVMAPPPRGDVPSDPAPPVSWARSGAAYGADYRLINPLVNSTGDFLAAFIGAGFLQNPAPSV